MNNSVIGSGKVIVPIIMIKDSPNINGKTIDTVGKDYFFKVIFQSCPMSLSQNNSVDDLWLQIDDNKWIPMKIGNKQYCSFRPYKTIFVEDVYKEPISIMDENNSHYILYPIDLIKE